MMRRLIYLFNRLALFLLLFDLSPMWLIADVAYRQCGVLQILIVIIKSIDVA